MRFCNATDCPDVATKRGWCDMHYQRWRRSGGTDPSEAAHEAKARREWEAAGRPHGTYLSRLNGCAERCCVPDGHYVHIPEGWRQSA